MKKIAIFASGNGSNAENIIRYFREKDRGAEVVVVVCNRREAGVYQRAENLGVPAVYVPKKDINDEEIMIGILKEYKVDFIVLAGFMLMIPDFLLAHYPNKMINIHPSLLPKYGGKGMYGHYVHEAVVANKESETGITIHYVSEKCDEGEPIFQASTMVSPDDSPEDVEAKSHQLEKEHFPRIVEEVVSLL